MRKFLLIVIVALLMVPAMKGSHLVGGDFTYECLGNHNYRLKLTIFRDCNTGVAGFDAQVPFGIYNGTTLLNVKMVPITNTYPHIPLVPDSCSPPPPTVCVEYAEYIDTFYLPPHPAGYNISHQRCCRNNAIVNIVNSGQTGNTWHAAIPPNDSFCNSSVDFLTFPSLLLCYNQPMEIEMPHIDPDGDSLVFSLCDPLLGGGLQQNQGPMGIIPNPPTPPPYASPSYSPGFTSQVPITGSPDLTINPVTGTMMVIPSPITGLFTVTICVDEYRNGVLINTVKREMQFVVANCVLQTKASIVPQANLPSNALCNGLTIEFLNFSSGMNSAYWKFNDTANAPNDTSTAFNPVYTFSDTGVYEVMLIINKGHPICADTTIRLFEVRLPVDNEFIWKPSPCLDKGLEFEMTGTPLSQYAKIEWNFGNNATPQTFNGRHPPPVYFSDDGGPYIVTLETEDFTCKSTYTEELTLFPRVGAEIRGGADFACAPQEITFNADITSSGPVEIFWDMDDGSTYGNVRNIKHTYSQHGTYYPTILIRSINNCVDTFAVEIDPIVVYPSPYAELRSNLKELSVYNPLATFYSNMSDDVESSELNFDDGQFLSPAPEICDHQYIGDSARYRPYLAVVNPYGCTDTSWIDIFVIPMTNIFVPNAFHPNGNGMNDLFQIHASNVKDYKLYIFNRWGQQVFYSDNPEHHWDGTYNGEPSPSGVYVFRLDVIDNQEYPYHKTGNLMLVR
ncbi:MAG: gliding motility-associated C-terminal domain-containing protein [Cryomorphaceae bacterium]|nr:gliding motility-associated C-terminal domain-containing protein [Cryomorphaceae bacterium]